MYKILRNHDDFSIFRKSKALVQISINQFALVSQKLRITTAWNRTLFQNCAPITHSLDLFYQKDYIKKYF